MKPNSTDINLEIRRLLTRWYAGETTPGEEQLLVRMLRSAESLPPNLETDKRMLLSLHELGNAETEIPEEYAERISDALEREISSSYSLSDSRKSSAGKWYRSIGVAAAVLLCIGGVYVGLNYNDSTPNLAKLSDKEPSPLPGQDITQPLPGESTATAIKPIEDQLGHIQKETMALADKSHLKTERARGTNRNGEVKGPDDNSEVSESRYPSINPESPYYGIDDLTPEEAEVLANGNYRIITDASDTNEIVNFVFSELEARVNFSIANLEETDSSFENKMTQLYRYVDMGEDENNSSPADDSESSVEKATESVERNS